MFCWGGCDLQVVTADLQLFKVYLVLFIIIFYSVISGEAFENRILFKIQLQNECKNIFHLESLSKNKLKSSGRFLVHCVLRLSLMILNLKIVFLLNALTGNFPQLWMLWRKDNVLKGVSSSKELKARINFKEGEASTFMSDVISDGSSTTLLNYISLTFAFT